MGSPIQKKHISFLNLSNHGSKRKRYIKIFGTHTHIYRHTKVYMLFVHLVIFKYTSFYSLGAHASGR